MWWCILLIPALWRYQLELKLFVYKAIAFNTQNKRFWLHHKFEISCCWLFFGNYNFFPLGASDQAQGLTGLVGALLQSYTTNLRRPFGGDIAFLHNSWLLSIFLHCWGLNPGPPACQASAGPLSYISSSWLHLICLVISSLQRVCMSVSLETQVLRHFTTFWTLFPFCFMYVKLKVPSKCCNDSVLYYTPEMDIWSWMSQPSKPLGHSLRNAFLLQFCFSIAVPSCSVPSFYGRVNWGQEPLRKGSKKW